jgi:Sulfatase
MRTVGPWSALAAVWAVFDLPMALAPDRVDFGLVRPTGEILLLLTGLGLSYRVRNGHPLRWLLAGLAVLFAVVRIDAVVFFVVSRTEPLLYDQLFMFKHLAVLVSDLFSAELFLSLVGVALAVALTGSGVRALLRRSRALLAPSRQRETTLVGQIVWTLVALATAFGPRPPRIPWVRWMTPDLVRNVAESRRVYHATRKQITESPYVGFDSVRLLRKPDVYLLFVESYGKLIAEHPGMRPAWVDAVSHMDERLSRAGWHAVSAYSTAPVSGGRSWLAVGSILMGTPIKYEAEFRQLVVGMDRVPTLERFFAKRGYETVLLAPSDRSRLGVKAENRYGYDHYIRFSDLDYRGPPTGWGVVPDQYALGYAEEHVLRKVRRPLFFHFHMVSSHAPWEVVPEYRADFHSWNQGAAAPTENDFSSEISRRLEHYSREDARDSYMGALTEPLREGFLECVLYDLRVVEEFLATRRNDALVILMGDHQPPVVAPETVGFDVPIHAFARDPKLLSELVDHGFSPGLVLPANAPAVVEHAGLFSLLVRTLARSSGDGAPLPPYYPHGTSRE